MSETMQATMLLGDLPAGVPATLPEIEAELARLGAERGEAVRAIDAIRLERLWPIDDRLRELLNEWDRHRRGAYAATASRPVDLRLADVALSNGG